ncbi:MAG: SHOCT domain-containing protein [Deltaproteobacteria bacterium]|nr:SHOCT domain-containing protein [Deltaproteobacteria bacterium]
MKAFRIFLMMVFLVTAAGVAGCGGGGAELKSHTKTTTLGQELTDLDAAYKKGVITKEQYEASKEKLLEKE